MVSAPVVRDRKYAFCDERAELQAILSSPLFQRAPKLSKILAYVCEQYFSGKAAELKEYSIAVDALGRSPGFDPQTDAIVRVDLHLLRKRLERYYADDGSGNRVRVVLPPGHYAPEFIPNVSSNEAPAESTTTDVSIITIAERRSPRRYAEWLEACAETARALIREAFFPVVFPTSIWIQHRAARMGSICAVVGVAIGIGGTLLLDHQRDSAPWIITGSAPAKMASSGIERISGSANNLAEQIIRIRCGSEENYVDAAGLPWRADSFYSGGTPFREEAGKATTGADPAIFSTGRRGVFRYDIPVARGAYEVRLLFWQTALDEQTDQKSSFVVRQASSDTPPGHSRSEGNVTMKTYYGVLPGVDGKIQINSESVDGSLNALEIVPEPK